jgi:hypothetical protein
MAQHMRLIPTSKGFTTRRPNAPCKPSRRSNSLDNSSLQFCLNNNRALLTVTSSHALGEHQSTTLNVNIKGFMQDECDALR